MALLGVRARKGGPKFQKGAARETPKTLRPERGQAPAETHREKKPQGARGACLGPGSLPGTGRPRKRPWPRAALQGPPLADASLPFRPGCTGRAGGLRRSRQPRRPRRPPFGIFDFSGSAARYCIGFGFPLRALGSRPSRALTPDPPSCFPPAAFTCSWRRRRGCVVECATQSRGSAPLSRSHCTLSSSARPANSSGRGIGGAGEGLLTSAQRGDTAALRPAVEKQPLS